MPWTLPLYAPLISWSAPPDNPHGRETEAGSIVVGSDRTGTKSSGSLCTSLRGEAGSDHPFRKTNSVIHLIGYATSQRQENAHDGQRAADHPRDPGRRRRHAG